MKIAWFTPFTPESGISRYSKIATKALSKFMSIDLWVCQKENLLDTDLKVIYYSTPDDQVLLKLSEYDVIVYNMGNNVTFHELIYEVSQRHKGVMIMHDYVMQHFWSGYLGSKKLGSIYNDMIKKYYGLKHFYRIPSAEGKQSFIQVRFEKFFRGLIRRIGKKTKLPTFIPLWESDNVTKYPLFEPIIKNALAVVCHSNFATKNVRRRFFKPTKTVYFPFASEYSEDLSSSRELLEVPEDKVIMLTAGYVHFNKRIEQVIKLLAADKELAKKVVYMIIGSTNNSYAKEQIKFVKDNNLENVVQFKGFLADDQFHKYLLCADICINLRYPIIEGASWSIVEEMYYAKPTIVINDGFYRELPDDSVLKINLKNEQEELQKALHSVVFDKDLREKIGQNARYFTITKFNPELYAQNLNKFLEKLMKKSIIDLISHK